MSQTAENFLRGLIPIASRRLEVVELGVVNGQPIVLLTPYDCYSNLPSVLIAAGFHGTEIAGPFGILDVLKNSTPSDYAQANVSFLPLVVPSSLATDHRTNGAGEYTNQGFCHQDKFPGEEPCAEGRILLQHLPRLVESARHGFMTMHENMEEDNSYVYAFEDGDVPSDRTLAIRQELTRGFRPEPETSIVVDDEEVTVVNGIVLNRHDGSFEDRMFHEGIPFSICTETPGKEELQKRINVNSNLIRRFIQLVVSA